MHRLVWSLTILILSAGFAAAPARADKRVALVIGNSAYVNVSRLTNPANDARLIAESLRSVGFTLVGGGAQLDLDRSAFDNAIQRFGEELQGADVGLFYYAGHGVQVRGNNYLVPVSANLTREADVDFQVIDVNLVLRQMEGAGTKLNLVILDACRNNPFTGRGLRATGGGLAQMQAPEGTLISYATEPGSVAQDGTGGNSPFSKALAQTIRRPGLGIFDAFNEVGLAVKQATGGAQQPWVSSSPIVGHFQFAAAPASSTAPAAIPGTPSGPSSSTSEAERAWSLARDTSSPAVLDAFIKRFGDSFYADLARARLAELNAGGSRPPAAPPARNARLGNPSSGEWMGAGGTASVTFGGPPFCKYKVSMQNLNLTASIDDAGRVSSAKLTAVMVETPVGRCPYASLGTRNHTYTGSGIIDGNTITLELNPDPGNAPHASAAFTGQIVNGRLNGALILHRVDARSNLAWTLQSVVK